MSDIAQTVIDIIAKEGSVAREKITMDATLQQLDIHSLDAVQIIFELEDKFDISVPDGEADYAGTPVSELIKGVERLIAAKTPAP